MSGAECGTLRADSVGAARCLVGDMPRPGHAHAGSRSGSSGPIVELMRVTATSGPPGPGRDQGDGRVQTVAKRRGVFEQMARKHELGGDRRAAFGEEQDFQVFAVGSSHDDGEAAGLFEWVRLRREPRRSRCRSRCARSVDSRRDPAPAARKLRSWPARARSSPIPAPRAGRRSTSVTGEGAWPGVVLWTWNPNSIVVRVPSR